MFGGHLLKSWAKTAAVLAVSSGEAELMAVVRGSTESLGLRSIFEDFGLRVKICLKSDATAAIGIVARLGLGKVRHLAVPDFWVQQRARSGEIDYSKVDGKTNHSDLCTKALDANTMRRHMEAMGLVIVSGRASSAPKARMR